MFDIGLLLWIRAVVVVLNIFFTLKVMFWLMTSFVRHFPRGEYSLDRNGSGKLINVSMKFPDTNSNVSNTDDGC